MKFTKDWFSSNIDVYNKHMDLLANKHNILEIGSYEGRSATWFYENLLAENGAITCVDCFDYPYSDNPQLASISIEKRLRYNLSHLKNKNKHIRIIKEKSHIALSSFIVDQCAFDLIYIDGSHTEIDALTDAVLAFRCLEKTGVMIFDDCYETMFPVNRVVDVFCDIYKDHLDVIHRDYQAIIQKTT